jgi:peptide/nickel transport system permease protein
MKHLVHRLVGGLIVLWLVSVLTFLLVHMVPGDAADAVAGQDATPAEIARLRHEMGLDRPLIMQYLHWSGNLLRGDMGRSLFSNTPVTHLITEAAPVTLSLALVALAFSILVGIPAGALAASRRGGLVDGVISTIALVNVAMPTFWVAMILITMFSLTLHLFPATGYQAFSGGLGGWFSHIFLPGVALGLGGAGVLARQTRDAVIGVLGRPFIQSSRARGAGGWWLVRHHVLRNSSIPVLTILGLHAGQLLGGAIVIESVAGMNGLGTLVLHAIGRRDFPIIQGYVLLCAVIIVVINLLVDLAYTKINPKVRAQ